MNIQTSKRDARPYGKDVVYIRGLRFFECYYKRKRCYGVQQLSTGYCAVFNHRKRVLNALIDTVKKGTSLCTDICGNMTMYYKDRKHMTLAKYLYCIYNGINEDGVTLENNIRHRERSRKMIEDCREKNLYMGSSSVHYDEKGKRIFAVSNTEKFFDIFSPVQIIIDILSKCSLYICHDNRVMFRHQRDRFMLSDLAYLAYYDSDLTVANFVEKLQALKDYKKDHDLTLEHLDGDFHNHQKYNIALVKRILNIKKNAKISNIVEPFFFTVVFEKPYHSGIDSNGQFKILIGKFDDDLMLTAEKAFITDCFENVVNMLDIYINEYPTRVNKKEALLNNERLIFDYRFAEVLAREPDEHFICLDTL